MSGSSGSILVKESKVVDILVETQHSVRQSKSRSLQLHQPLGLQHNGKNILADKETPHKRLNSGSVQMLQSHAFLPGLPPSLALLLSHQCILTLLFVPHMSAVKLLKIRTTIHESIINLSA